MKMWEESELVVERRRSARISALEEEKRSSAASTSRSNSYLVRDNRQSQTPVTARTSASTSKKGCKRRRLEDVVLSPQQDGEDNSIKNEQAALSSVRQVPEKRLLVSILDALQRKDTMDLFAVPVDREKVASYYTIIKQPMDFATMRAKMYEGMYTSLEQFEHDIQLISSNAMHFNASTTIFHREALAIQELAHQIFHALKFEPERLESLLSTKRSCRGRKPQSEAGCSTKKRGRPRGAKTRKQADLTIGEGHKEKSPGLRDGLRLSLIDTTRRQTYMRLCNENESWVSTVYNSPKSLHPVDSGLGYTESLMRFAKGLGPTAQMVAKKKLESLHGAPNCQPEATLAIQDQTSPASGLSAPRLLDYPLGFNSTQMTPMPQNSLLSLPSESNVPYFHGNDWAQAYAPWRSDISINEGGYKGLRGISRFGMESNQNDTKGKTVLQTVIGKDTYNKPLQQQMPIDRNETIDISGLTTSMGLQGPNNVRLESHICVVRDFAHPETWKDGIKFKAVDMLAKRENQASRLLQQAKLSRAGLQSNQLRLEKIMSSRGTNLRQSPYLPSPAPQLSSLSQASSPLYNAFGAIGRLEPPSQWHQNEPTDSQSLASLLADFQQPNLTLHL